MSKTSWFSCRLGMAALLAPAFFAMVLAGCAAAKPSSPVAASPAAAIAATRVAPTISTVTDDTPTGIRVMVKLVQPSTDRMVVAVRAQDLTGLPVRDNGAVSDDWHALSLDCANAAACNAAVARLRAATGIFLAVETDGRRHPLTP